MNLDDYLPEKFASDLNMSSNEMERILLLTPSEVARIDNWLLSFAIHRGRKVAFLVMSAMQQLTAEIPSVPDAFYILRVQKLIEEGRLELDGNMDFWRQSEVRLPPGEIEWK
ncbi:MAG: hypothetical protein IPL32_12180 [Chloracidobacterium sp.]|nr:hypothetical protein [Chloracidobacterium sp.]